MGQQKSILIIDDNEDDYIMINRFINHSFSCVYLDGSGDIIHEITNLQPECILLDYNLKCCKGSEILQQIKKNDAICNIAVIMMTNEVNPSIVVDCIKNEASNYLIKDTINKESLHVEILRALKETELKIKVVEQQKEIAILSQTDYLTGMLNRRYFQSKLDEVISLCKRSEHFFTYALLDVDYFKKVNDTFGHIEGDNVIKIVADTITQSIRNVDIACRYGGDEFIIVLNEFMHLISQQRVYEHLKKLDAIRIQIGKNITTYLNEVVSHLTAEELKAENTFAVSVSMGVTYYKKNHTKIEWYLSNADNCLYKVKEHGRNGLAYTNIYDEICIFNEGEDE